MGASVSNMGGGMVELATIAMNTTYTGNEPWVAEMEKFDMIYLETNLNGVSDAYSMATQIYSLASFKKILDEGKQKTIYFLTRSFSGNNQSVRISNGHFYGIGASSMKIYGVKL